MWLIDLFRRRFAKKTVVRPKTTPLLSDTDHLGMVWVSAVGFHHWIHLTAFLTNPAPQRSRLGILSSLRAPSQRFKTHAPGDSFVIHKESMQKVYIGDTIIDADGGEWVTLLEAPPGRVRDRRGPVKLLTHAIPINTIAWYKAAGRDWSLLPNWSAMAN